jgi:hypothetical protein
MTTATELAADALLHLGSGQSLITEESLTTWPNLPGLYAVYGSAEICRQLGLGEPPDDRPLYVGKAERSLSSRDVGDYFGFRESANSVTGSSTLRRSIAALLRTELGFRARYRNPAVPGYPDKYGLSREQDMELSAWMRNNLPASYWEMTAVDVRLSDVETQVLRELQPPVNLQKVSHQWTKMVRAARRVMAADCASVASEHPSPGS